MKGVIYMNSIIDIHEAKKNKQIRKMRNKNGYRPDQESQGTFVARLPYPLYLSDIISVVERMGIMEEEKILPELYKLQKKLSIKED